MEKLKRIVFMSISSFKRHHIIISTLLFVLVMIVIAYLIPSFGEKAVQDSLEKLIQNRTAIVIAHRLSTIRNAKRILVLTDNGIEEQGTHKELLGFNGVYANLYNMQLRIEDSL